MKAQNYVRLFSLLIIAGLLAGAAFAAGQPDSSTIAKCKTDLAKRLGNTNVGNIVVVDAQPTVWPDGALGLPEAGKVYTMALVPGFKITLEARNTRYYYSASNKNIRYGGSVYLWKNSLLYVRPVSNEPNLNGDLYQCSLLGTNCVRIASGVSDFYAQPSGTIIYTERTSRSGFDLFYIKPGDKKPRQLSGSFAFAGAAFNTRDDKWAAIERPGLGTEWIVVIAPIASGRISPQQLPLPNDVRPEKIAWSGEKVVIAGRVGDRPVAYEIAPGDAKPEWKAIQVRDFPNQPDYMLNKSQSLEISQVTVRGKPAVEVAKVWFTGERDVVATIEGVTLKNDTLLPYGFAFIWGDKNGNPVAYSVDISTGEVIAVASGIGSDVKPVPFPPKSNPFGVK